MTTAKNLLTAAVIAACGSVMAQGNQSWTATDINGNTIDIQAMLNQGKTVLVDISAHWCGPCWSWHKTGIMDKAWEEFGPNGTGDLEIIWVDGDATTTLAELQGTGSTQGDWITGTPFPIIGPNGEGGAVANNYSFPGYPTLFMHCPGSPAGVEISRAGFESFMDSWYNGCSGPFDHGANDATLYGNHDGIEICPGGTGRVELVNVGTSNLTSATVKMMDAAGATLETVNWTGNLGHFETEWVDFTGSLSAGTYGFEVTMPNGMADANAGGDTESIDFVLAPDANIGVEVEIITDNYGSETYWRIMDPAGMMLAEGGNVAVGTTNVGVGGGTAPADPSAYASGQTYTTNVNFTSTGCHTFEIYDYYGDGICCAYGTGSFTIKDLTSGMVLSTGGEFATADARQANALTVGINDVTASNSLNIFPNPSTGLVNVQLTTTNPEFVSIEVYNLLGELVVNRSENFASGVNIEEVDLSQLNNGVYVFSVNAGGVVTTERVTINK